MRIQFIFFLASVLLCVLFSAMIWEFTLEPIVSGWISTDHDSETTQDKWKFVYTAIIFSGLALIFPTLIAFQILNKKQEAEKALKVSTEKLIQSNKDLKSFALIATHDLQEPLRKIITFGDRLETRIPETDEQGRNYLNRMRNSALRMRGLVEDLFQYTQLENKQRPFESIDLNKVTETVLEDLEIRIRDTQGVVNIADLPVIDGDPIQIHQLFLNLISNALKFHREGVPPVVNLNSVKREDGFWTISVEDNGIGIEEEHIDKIFQPFARLHDRKTYEGTGIGLSICQKIVSRHAGKITVKRKSTHGVTFHITLPEKQNSLSASSKSGSFKLKS